MQPTAQQKNILDAIRSGNDNLAIVARAGCGKTSTLLMAVDQIVAENPRAEVAICAFNKAIADEVSEKLRERGHTNWRTVGASTIHSMGYGLLKFMFKPTIDDKKVRRLIEARNEPVFADYSHQIETAVKMAKAEGFGFFDQIGDVGAWYRMAEHYGINGFEDTTHMDLVIEAAQSVYRESLQVTSVIDFDDMILMPLVRNLRVRFQKDWLLVDESQDLSRTRQALFRKFVKSTGRVILVGDDRQAIYGFAGADAEALSNLTRSLRAKVFPLSVTWRCPVAVVQEAQRYVPDIEARPGAPEGVVRHVDEQPDLQVGDAVLCRNTAPLIELAYKLIRSGVPAKVEGRDIGAGLKVLVNRWKVKTIDAFLRRLQDCREREVQKAVAKDREDRAEQIADKCETVRQIAEECVRLGSTNLADVNTFIDELFADGDTRSVTLATYHRSKGREWDKVVLFQHAERCPSRAAKQEWKLVQEGNLAYVAITRAMKELVYWK